MGGCASSGRKSDEEISRKVAIVGDSNTGKSCLINRFINDEFDEDLPREFIPTALKVEEKVQRLKNGQMVRLFIYDTGGQETFKHLRKLNYPKSDAAIICFSVDNPDSLEDVGKRWVSDMRSICPKIPLLLVGTKRDLRDDAPRIEGFVRESKGHAMARDKKMVGYLECSSMDGNGVEEVFKVIAREAAKVKASAKVNDSEFNNI